MMMNHEIMFSSLVILLALLTRILIWRTS